ncbi:hypothetical protein [Alicyclobacillus shizuokensis]|uniref:hypothetical protein n=1 Tax=Alicyclobacillus shizuokensis TaxID=392014 RepID=UPI0008345556|nr:hypothetical protein [Alicyclobacillus shizuokensis]
MEAQYHRKRIVCTCGEEIETDLESELVEEAEFNVESLKDSRRYECPRCGQTYELTIGVSVWVEVDVDEVKVTPLYEPPMGLDGNPVDFEGCFIGDEVALEDGQYRIGSMLYVVENGRLAYRWNTTVTESQLWLFDPNSEETAA